MKRRLENFERNIGIDESIIKRLQEYLIEREDRLARELLTLIPAPSLKAHAPQLPSSEVTLKLLEGVKLFITRLQHLPNAFTEHKQEKLAKVNKELWEYAWILESSAVELFQQVKQTSIDCWHLSVNQIVLNVKEMISRHIEDLLQSISLLQEAIKNAFKKGSFLFYFWEKPIEGAIKTHLIQTEKKLSQNYQKFSSQYQEFKELDLQVDEESGHVEEYPILGLMEEADQNIYIDLFRLIKGLSLNQKGSKETNKLMMEAVKRLASIETMHRIFTLYLGELKEAFFSTSLEWKCLNNEGHPLEHTLEVIKSKLEDYRIELHDLLYLVGHYRHFLLKSDPNPYIRARWGFSEWIVAPEPPQIKSFIDLIYSAENLKEALERFIASLKEDPAFEAEAKIKKEAFQLLHDLGQPLISKKMTTKLAENLLERLEACNEVGSPHLSSLSTMQSLLSRAMREDWKYNVLHQFPLFHKIYSFHKGLAGTYQDVSHYFRLEKFHHLFKQIEDWVGKETLHAHVHEIESDIHDIKSYLQDFLANVQRAFKGQSKDVFFEETRQKIELQLLEYRYIFGRFFFLISRKNESGQELRNQFLFVDDYFESVEILLNH